VTGARVFDTGPLSHFAEAGWLRLLHAVAGDREVIIPEAVRSEIAMAAHIYPSAGRCHCCVRGSGRDC
jgi:predicted nucleic acid-binding protein